MSTKAAMSQIPKTNSTALSLFFQMMPNGKVKQVNSYSFIAYSLAIILSN